MKFLLRKNPECRSILLLFCIFVCILNSRNISAQDQPLVRNYLRVKAILKEDSPIYLQPSTNSEEIDSAKQFSVVFIFSPGGSSSDYIRDGFYRVGKKPDKALGWIPEDLLREWDHRICLHFTSLVGRQPALVYGSERDAEEALRSSTANRSKSIAEEPGDISKNRYSMLLPVLEDRTVTSGKVMKAYKIGYLAGESSGSVPPTPPSQSVSSGGGLGNLELLFVLDTTASMEPYIEGAKRVIGSVSDSVRTMTEAGTHIGLLCYRDYIQNQPDMEYVTKKFSPLTRSHRQVIDILENEVHHTNISSEEYPEAVFDGLYAAITETDWNKVKSSLRIIVLIGDASGHPSGDDKNPMNYSLQQLLDTASDNRVRIVAIKIISEREDDNPIHQEQMQTLAQGNQLSDRGSYHEVELIEDVDSPEFEEYVEELTASIETEIAQMRRLIAAVKNPSTIQNLTSSDKAIILKNLKPSQTGANSVTFSEGWVCERDPEDHPQVSPYVFMSYDDLALNIFYLQTAHTLAKSPTDAIYQSIAKTVRAESGEEWKQGESLAEHYQKKFGLPTTSRLLRFSYRDIANWGEQRRIDLAKAIKSKIGLMEEHRDNPENWYKLGGDYRYTFVPLSYLP